MAARSGGKSLSPSSPRAANRPRHLRTVSTLRCRSAAIRALAPPRDAASTICARNWPQLTRVKVTYRGTFGYVTGVLRDGPNSPPCRLRYGGSAHSFGIAIYSAARDRCQDAVLHTGLPAGAPQQALDTARTIRLAGLGHEPGS